MYFNSHQTRKLPLQGPKDFRVIPHTSRDFYFIHHVTSILGVGLCGIFNMRKTLQYLCELYVQSRNDNRVILWALKRAIIPVYCWIQEFTIIQFDTLDLGMSNTAPVDRHLRLFRWPEYNNVSKIGIERVDTSTACHVLMLPDRGNS